MQSTALRRLPILAPLIALPVCTSTALADLAPPVSIRMPADTKPATAGQAYEGTFEVHVYKPGSLDDFKLAGEGWVIAESDAPRPRTFQPGVFTVSFLATPSDADKPIGLSLTYNGRKVHRSYEIGPAYFSKAGQVHRAIDIRPPGEANMPEEPAGDGARDVRSPLRVVGRIVYTRPCRDLSNPADGDCNDPEDMPQRIIGADQIDVRVWDSDTIGHEEIWSGYTDANGFFDTGTVDWDDGDDDPDLVVYFETDTVTVDVTDATVLESTYEFETGEVGNFTGSYYDFGWLAPGDPGLHPAFHIFNSVVRTHRFIQTRAGIDTPKVQVEWPHGDTGAWYESGPVEIHMSTERSWRNETASHEYGHHFMHFFSATTEPDYCNGICDESEDDCGHCIWCEETDHDAWNEGWPNWLADVVTRSYPDDYTYDDGSPFQPLYSRDQENVGPCTTNGPLHDPFITEGFPGALLRDIEDSMQDDSDGDGIRDALCLGFDEIFYIVTAVQPTTPAGFIGAFLTTYPEHANALWSTAYNVHPSYVQGFFPPDTDPPSGITVLDSSSHPLGGSGTSPCIEVTWEPPDDDSTGVCEYTYQWTISTTGVPPTFTARRVDFSGCLPSVVSPPRELGDHYFSIRARDCDGNWDPDYVTFGPFVVDECNNNGIHDVCEIACDMSGADLACALPPDFCNVPGCGAGQDCNANLVPDDCDLASGFSDDCNLNAIPDECETMYHWDGGFGSWHSSANWLESGTPTSGADVCISTPGDVTVEYSNDVSEVAVLACYESLSIAGGTIPWAEFTINEPSWVSGDLGLSGNRTVLTVNDRLDIGGLFTWTGSNVSSSAKLAGSGVTYANGGALVAETVHLGQHHFVLDGNSVSVVEDGRVEFISPSVFEIRPGSTYEHRGDGYIVNGWLDDRFVNRGTLINSVDPGLSLIHMFTDNSGLIHVQAGTLKFYLGSSSTGDFLVDPGATLEFVGGRHDLLAGSSIVAQDVVFSGGAAGNNSIAGSYNVTGTTTITGSHTITFQPTATVSSYGVHLAIAGGLIYFEPVLGATITFDDVTLTGGTAYFNSGDPIQTATLTIGPGIVRGPSDVTVTGLLTWNPGGRFIGLSTVNANGGMLIGSGGSVKTLRDRTINNTATATFLGGLEMAGDAIFNNLATGVIDIQTDTTVMNYGTLNNDGTIVKTAGSGTSRLGAKATNTGVVEVQAGTLELYTHYGQFYTQTAGQTTLNGGDIAMFGPAPMQLDGGTLGGVGTITGHVVNAAAIVSPGLSVGQLDVNGDYTQHAAGTMQVELDGTGPGLFDTLVVTEAAALAGDLEVTLTSGFVPSDGDTFQIITADSVFGEFESVNITNPPPDMVLRADYGPGSVTLIALYLPIEGDCDGDYYVGSDDFALFAPCMAGPDGGLGQDCGCTDFDGDGDSDLADFAMFECSFNGSANWP